MQRTMLLNVLARRHLLPIALLGLVAYGIWSTSSAPAIRESVSSIRKLPLAVPHIFLPQSKDSEEGGSWHDDPVARAVEALYRPILHPITSPKFTDEDGTTYRIAGEPTYKSSLGKRVLILDVDTRSMTELMGEEVKWNTLQPMAAGVLSHYLYAMIHGYDYRFVRAPAYPDRHVTWSKVPVIQAGLRTHEFVVFLDQDAMFHRPHIPIEWLMNHWNHTSETLLMVSEDPDLPQNKDSNGHLFWNTGFIIAQNSSRTHELFDTWVECPHDTSSPGCSHYAYQWPHEQGALRTHIQQGRFNSKEDIHPVPCSEANGSPWVQDEYGPGCTGVFVRHYWANGKPHPPEELVETVMQYFIKRLHMSFVRGQDWFLVHAPDFA